MMRYLFPLVILGLFGCSVGDPEISVDVFEGVGEGVVSLHGYIVHQDGQFFIEPFSTRGSENTILIELNFAEDTLSCLDTLPSGEGVLVAYYSNGQFDGFESFGSILNMHREMSDEPMIGCWAD